MRFGIVFALSHEGKLSVFDGPGLPDEINADLKKLVAKAEGTHSDVAELHFHEIHLGSGRKRFAFAQPLQETEAGEALDDLTIENLQALGTDQGIDLVGCKLKQDYVDRIRGFRALDEEMTLDQLKTYASEKEIDVTGCKLKAEYLNTILAWRRENEQPPQ